MMFRLFDLITEENFLSGAESTLIELERTQFSMSCCLNSTCLSYTLGSVCDSATARKITGACLLWKFDTVSFFLIGCSPSWYLSGRIEFTRLISRNFMFLIGLLKLSSLASRGPFLEVLALLAEFWRSWVLVERGRILGLILSISSLFSYPSSGLLSDPDSSLAPHSKSSLLVLSSVTSLTKGDVR